MNIQQLRQSLKLKWVNYYYKNRAWLVKMRVWGTYNGSRRPSSSFILATVSILEPELEQFLPFIVELNSDPDGIVSALGLNFNPEEELDLVNLEAPTAENQISNSLQETLLNGKSSSNRVATVVESKSQPVGFVEITGEFESKSLPEILCDRKPWISTVVGIYEESKTAPSLVATIGIEESTRKSLPLVSAGVSPKIESKSDTVPTVAVEPSTVENESTLVPSWAFFSKEVALQSKFFRAVDFATELELKSSPISPVAVATCHGENDNQFRQMVALYDNTAARNCVSRFAIDTNVESKDRFVTIPHNHIQKEVNLLPKHRVRHLADWIDECCQGRG
ncbi:hypothetical protein NUACC21_76190 [Scytonema sp. NUACC21]